MGVIGPLPSTFDSIHPIDYIFGIYNERSLYSQLIETTCCLIGFHGNHSNIMTSLERRREEKRRAEKRREEKSREEKRREEKRREEQRREEKRRKEKRRAEKRRAEKRREEKRRGTFYRVWKIEEW